MPFDHIRGQAPAIDTLTRALQGNVVHHAYRFEGPEGVGKELTAMAFAQALVCAADGRGPQGFGCGRCEACRRAVQLAEDEPRVPLHPDVVLIGRGLYPAEIIGKKENIEISVEQIRRVVLSRAAYAPHEGRAQVFIVRAADELSISAANALLKTLEEPRPATHFILLSARPEKLLDTIRSRSLPVRFAPLPDEVVAEILTARGLEADADTVAMAAGSASLAIELSDADASASRHAFVRKVLEAVDAPDMQEAVQLGESLEQGRDRLIDDLRALALAYARRARQELGDRGHASARAEIDARRHDLVIDAIDAVERNGSAALAVASLIASLRHGWLRRPGDKPPIVVQRR